jgi:acyl carrier protein
MNAVNPQELESRLLRFVNDHLLPEDVEPVDATTALFAEGRINSLRLLNLLAFVERTLDREIPEEEIVMDRFHSVRRIAQSFGGSGGVARPEREGVGTRERADPPAPDGDRG